MKVVILYRPNSEHERLIETYVHDYKATHAGFLEVVNVDTREGIALVELYDIVSYPAILALQDDGSMQKMWQGTDLPLMDEVASYVSS